MAPPKQPDTVNPADDDSVRVIRIDAVDTHDLRRRVLRDQTPSTQVVFDGDCDPTTLHFGAVDQGSIVGIASLMRRNDPDRPDSRELSYQLRGMATDPARRGTGIGSVLLAAAIESATAMGAHELWARARITALDFYLQAGFEAYGHDVLDDATGMWHRSVRRRLSG